MARRRMFTAELIDSDRFTDLPIPAQMLYICLAIHADDEGFLSSAKRLSQSYGGTAHLQLLEEADFIIRFDTGVVAIVDWFLNNSIRKDRSTATNHKKERSSLTVINGRYVRNESLQDDVNQVTTTCQPIDNHLATQNRLEENRKEYIILDNNRSEYPAGGNAEQEEGLDEEASMTENKEPSITDISEFIDQEGLRNIEATQFWCYYYTKNWRDKDGNPIQDWRALARSWNNRSPCPG